MQEDQAKKSAQTAKRSKSTTFILKAAERLSCSEIDFVLFYISCQIFFYSSLCLQGIFQKLGLRYCFCLTWSFIYDGEHFVSSIRLHLSVTPLEPALNYDSCKAFATQCGAKPGCSPTIPERYNFSSCELKGRAFCKHCWTMITQP